MAKRPAPRITFHYIMENTLGFYEKHAHTFKPAAPAFFEGDNRPPPRKPIGNAVSKGFQVKPGEVKRVETPRGVVIVQNKTPRRFIRPAS